MRPVCLDRPDHDAAGSRQSDLDEDGLDAGRVALGRARDAGRRIRDLIDDHLAYTVTREGTLRRAPVDLATLAEDLSASCSGRVAPATVEVTADHVVQGDPALLHRLLDNLVGSALARAHPAGPAHVRVTSVLDEDPGWVRVRIEDWSRPMSEDDLALLLAPASRDTPGSVGGHAPRVGLALCHAIVARHHGQISATVNEWGGTTVEFTLPMAHALVS